MFTRPYPPATAGIPRRIEFDAESREFIFEFEPDFTITGTYYIKKQGQQDYRSQLLHSSRHQKWLPFQILGVKAVKKVTNNRDMAKKAKRYISEGVIEGVSDTLIREKLSF